MSANYTVNKKITHKKLRLKRPMNRKFLRVDLIFKLVGEREAEMSRGRDGKDVDRGEESGGGRRQNLRGNKELGCTEGEVILCSKSESA